MKFNNNDRSTVFDRTLSFFDRIDVGRAFLVLADAYYGCWKMVRGCLDRGAHLLTRVKSNAVAYLPPEIVKGRRKLRAYHCFLQAGVIAQGLMTAIGILVPEYCWSNYSSWMRTMNVSRTPSEWARAARPPKDVRRITRGCLQDAQLGEIHPRKDGLEAIQARCLTELAAAPPKILHWKNETPVAHAASAKLDGFTPQGENPSLSSRRGTRG